MREQEVPTVGWERGGRTGEHGNEVGLEGADGAFGGVAAVNMRRD